MKVKILICCTVLIMIALSGISAYSQVLTGSKTRVAHKENFGVKIVEIKTLLKNNSDKTVSKVTISVFFKTKNADAYDFTAPSDVKYSESDVIISPKSEKEVTFTVLEPKDINMVYGSAKIERAVFSDGSVIDF